MKNHKMDRRDFVAGVSAASVASALVTPALAQSDRSLKIATYGGYFEDAFKNFVYPAFTEATGIKVESVTQPSTQEWLAATQQANRAGEVLSDLALWSTTTLIRASRIGGVLAPLDAGNIQTLDRLEDTAVFRGSDDTLLGVGALSWFQSMVVNPEMVDIPDSWQAFFDTARYEQSLGLPRIYSSGVLDVIAATYFDGVSTFETRDGILALIEKAAELRPNVASWWTAESQMEQLMKNGDVAGGMYYYDVANLMAADGFPVAAVFPKEGNPQGYETWAQSALSEKGDLVSEFLTFSSDPATQALMSRRIGTAPVVPYNSTDLTPEEFGAVSGAPTIQFATQAYLDEETFIKEAWDNMLAGG